MQIHWFSPLLPINAPAAVYTAAVVPHLARTASVVLWAEQAIWDPAIEKAACVRRYSLTEKIAGVERCSLFGIPWREVNRGDLAVFHLGREAEYFGGIWRLFHMHSGIVVLHDARIHELFLGTPRPIHCEDRDFVAECERIYGQTGRLAAEIFRGGLCSPERMAKAFPLLDPILEAAYGVLVHDGELARALAQRRGPPVAYTPSPLEKVGNPDEYLRAFFHLAASAHARFAASSIMADRMAGAIKPLAKDRIQEAAIDRASRAIASLLNRPVKV